MTRSIRLPIAPATATTCGDGSGKFCQFLNVNSASNRAYCRLFGETDEGDIRHQFGAFLRWPECIAAEHLAPR